MNPNIQNPSTSITTSTTSTTATTATTTMKKLNAKAEPFIPSNTQVEKRHAVAAQQQGRASAEERSIFITFSNGSPLTRQEIFEHFTSEYGRCVEHVYVHTRHERDPEFGRIIFTTLDFPRLILGNREVVKISVNNKPVWLKKYVPQSCRNNS